MDYKATEQSREIYGKDIINKIHDNGETLLHTAVNKGDKASVDSKSEYLSLLPTVLFKFYWILEVIYLQRIQTEKKQLY